MLFVDKLVGMDILNSVIENFMILFNKEDWLLVNMNVVDVIVIVISEKNEEDVLVECCV